MGSYATAYASWLAGRIERLAWRMRSWAKAKEAHPARGHAREDGLPEGWGEPKRNLALCAAVSAPWAFACLCWGWAA